MCTDFQQKRTPHAVLVLWLTCVVCNNMQTVIKPHAALHNMSKTYLSFKEYVFPHCFSWLLVSYVVALLVLTDLQITGAQQTCQMARMERLHR